VKPSTSLGQFWMEAALFGLECKFLDDRGFVGAIRFFRSNRHRTEQAGPASTFSNTNYPTTWCTSILL
jgi:hypothetical protein